MVLLIENLQGLSCVQVGWNLIYSGSSTWGWATVQQWFIDHEEKERDFYNNSEVTVSDQSVQIMSYSAIFTTCCDVRGLKQAPRKWKTQWCAISLQHNSTDTKVYRKINAFGITQLPLLSKHQVSDHLYEEWCSINPGESRDLWHTVLVAHGGSIFIEFGNL